MLKDQCISITDLRLKTKECLQGLKKGEKYIFINNKPTAVLISMEDYETYFQKPMLIELSEDEVTPEMRAQVEKSKRTPKSELLNI